MLQVGGRPVAWITDGHSSAWTCNISIYLLAYYVGVWASEPMHQISLRRHQCWAFSGGRKGGFVGPGAFMCRVASLCQKLELPGEAS